MRKIATQIFSALCTFYVNLTKTPVLFQIQLLSLLTFRLTGCLQTVYRAGKNDSNDSKNKNDRLYQKSLSTTSHSET